MMLATRMIDLHRVFLYTAFQRMLLYGQNGSVSIVVREILLFKVAGSMLRRVRFDFEDGCHEHIPLVKSGEL